MVRVCGRSQLRDVRQWVAPTKKHSIMQNIDQDYTRLLVDIVERQRERETTFTSDSYIVDEIRFQTSASKLPGQQSSWCYASDTSVRVGVGFKLEPGI